MPPVLRRGLILLVCMGIAALLAAGCGDDDSGEESTATSTATTTESAPTSSKDAADRKKPKVVPPNGPPPKTLVKKTLIPGTGAEAKPGDEVTVNYVGVGFVSGTEFDSSFGREPFSFLLGGKEVIRGWDLGVAGMKVGERRELIIPPDLAYGSEGSGVIAPNATLVFVIDLLEAS
jgi:peptidylprolyl isomerase